jgi:hypothetical protein
MPIVPSCDLSSPDDLMNMIIKVIIAVIIVIIVHFFEGLTTSYNNIFYVDIRRGSRTCGIPVPSVFFNRNRNSSRILKRKWNRNSSRIPVHCKGTKRTSTSSRILVGVPLDTSQRIYELRLINAPKCKDTNPSSTAIKKKRGVLEAVLVGSAFARTL